MSRAFYNEIDAFAAEWTRNLSKAGHILDGDVDERSVVDVRPADVAGFRQCHFFSGIGVWSYALRRAGWPDDREVWTGSCPCQPFSSAGSGGGFNDKRHLWPAWFSLIRECRPPVIFGEQVASKDGLKWLDLVHSDLEGAGYAVGAVDLCAAGVGAPHIRQRLYFVAHAPSGTGGRRIHGAQGPQDLGRASTRTRGKRDAARGTQSALANNNNNRREVLGPSRLHGAWQRRDDSARRGEAGRLFWADAEWIPCSDGVSRPVEPGTFPLAHGAPQRVGRLRAYGNAINAEQAATFIGAVMDLL